jgi:DnaJ-class molecular chaperone
MDLKIDDLIHECSNCSGSGNRPVEPKERSGHGFGRNTIDFPNSRLNICPTCNGRKWELTESGEVFREFIQKLRDGGLLKF